MFLENLVLDATASHEFHREMSEIWRTHTF